MPSSTANAPTEHQHQHHYHKNRKSNLSISSVKSHQEYIDSLEVPSPEKMEQISSVQERKEEEVMKKNLQAKESSGEVDHEEREKAAGVIQRNYRGHRERRMLEGFSLDPSARWVEAVKEARYRNLTAPRPRESIDGASSGGDGTQHMSAARQNWKKVGLITRRAGGDEDSSSEESEDDEGVTAEERDAKRKRKAEEKKVRQKAAKLMDLQYFLEMVDLKHRYGSNLRTYHEEWKKSDTKENFFYWLDHGEGRFIDCAGCPRERLDKEQVRYLSKEERLQYLVKIDKEGRLCWAKNGARIDTTVQFKDSIHGIVPADDTTPPYAPARGEANHDDDHSSMSSSSSNDSDGEAARAEKYANPQLQNAKGIKKVKHVSAATIFNKLLRGSVKKNTWIFVADTSFRLYVGIKQSGAFQHSSFLHGSRISAAGLIKIKDGRLSKLSPLSGHYRPPVSNFRAFVHSLKDAGADMSHVSISRSYAVLVGLEAYVKSRRRGKKILRSLVHHRDKILDPEEVAKREEAERDKSESAAREQRFLEMQREAEEEEREENKANVKLLNKLHIRPKTPKHADTADTKEKVHDAEIQAPGTGPENAIAPEGTRNV